MITIRVKFVSDDLKKTEKLASSVCKEFDFRMSHTDIRLTFLCDDCGITFMLRGLNDVAFDSLRVSLTNLGVILYSRFSTSDVVILD